MQQNRKNAKGDEYFCKALYLKIYGKTWKWLSSNEQPVWQSLKNLENNNGQMLYNTGVEKLLETYPERLTAVITLQSIDSGVWILMQMRYLCI
jgi:hypothetical protein